MSKTTKKTELKKEEKKVAYLSADFLAQAIGKLKVNSYGDIAVYKKLLEKVDEIRRERDEKQRGLLDKYGYKPGDKVSATDDKYDELDAEYRELSNGFSSVNPSSLKLFTEEEFQAVMPSGVLSPAEAVALADLIVK